jgi:hypothetical protein
MKKMGADRMQIVTEYDDRWNARADERVLEEEMPGPWNKTPWAGKGKAALLPLLIAILTGDAFAAGEEFGNAIDPSVQDAGDGFNKFARTRWLDDEDAAILGG